MWLCSKSTGNESRLVTWRSHWECRAQTGPWWPTLKGWGGHVQKGSRGTWRAASRRAQFAADRRHCKRHSDILEELKLQYARGTEGTGSFPAVSWLALMVSQMHGLVTPTFCHPVHTCGHTHSLTTETSGSAYTAFIPSCDQAAWALFLLP